MHISNPRALTKKINKAKTKPQTKKEKQRTIADKSVLEINWSAKNT